VLVSSTGTVTDRRTCLVWEKKCSTGTECPAENPHNADNKYTWSTGPPWNLDGSAATVFLKQLNDAAFAGHTDWRLPTSAGLVPLPTGNDPELESILTALYPNCTSSPCIDPIFGPTAAAYHWFASSYLANPSLAWEVNFANGYMSGALIKNMSNCVRAVRGGPGVP
jgi:hypothetical protein